MSEPKSYLESWREKYSYPEYITGYKNSTQQQLLQGSAIGTDKNNFLDPIPLYNKIGKIYSDIINSAYESARTDALKMNRKNMDYTNGKEALKTGELTVFNFFKFFEDTQDEEVYTKENSAALSSFLSNLNTVITKQEEGVFSVESNQIPTIWYNTVKYLNKNWSPHITELQYFLKDEFGYDDIDSYFNILKVAEDTGTIEYIIPTIRMSALLDNYMSKYGYGPRGLQLLMPQYKRRVEVEDLNENFWVISQILDAVVNTLWGPYGLIDVVRQLILKVEQLDEKNNVQDIELLHYGDDDLYFDMYSRFTLAGLQLKLKTSSGERIIKDIFKGHTDKSDRKSTTDGFSNVLDVYQNINEEMYSGESEGTLWPQEKKNCFTGLYDSDLIRSKKPFAVNNTNYYASLSSVIDAINGSIVANNDIFSGYSYSRKLKDQEFFEIFDPTIGDKYFSVQDYENFKHDIEKDFVNTVLSKDEFERFKKYEQSYKALEKFVEVFGEEEILSDNSAPTGFYGKDLKKLYVEQYTLVKPTDNNFSIENYRIELQKIYTYLDTFFTNKKQSISYSEYYPEIFEVLYKQYQNILSICEHQEVSDVETQNSDWTIFTIPSQIIKYKNIIDIASIISPFSNSSSSVNYHSSASFLLNELTVKNDSTNNTLSDKAKKEILDFLNIFDDIEFSYKTNTSIEINGITDCTDFFNIELIDENKTMSLADFNEDIKTAYTTQFTEQNDTSYKKIINIKIDNSNGKSGIMQIDLAYSTRLAAKINSISSKNELTQVASIDGKILFYNTQQDINSIQNDIVGNANISEGEITFSTIQYKQYTFKRVNLTSALVYKDEYIPVYSYQVSRGIARYLSQELSVDNLIKNDFETTMKTMFDVYKEVGNELVTVRDAAAIDRFSKFLTSDYVKHMEKINGYIDKYYDTINLELGIKINLDTFFENLGITSNNKDDLKSKIFIYVDNPLKNFAFLTSFHKPTQDFLTILKSIDTLEKTGIDWSQVSQKEALLNSIEQTEYGLWDNILIYLFDADYYTLRKKKEQKFPSLYISQTDIFFSNKVNPLIPGDSFIEIDDSSYTIPIFVPREDLRNGEIIELRMSGKNSKRKVFDFDSAIKYVFSEETKQYPFLKESEKNTLSLQLYNSFADNISQYNYRTALFFKDTTPECFNNNSTSKAKSLDELFNQGIEVNYFKPIRVIESEAKDHSQTIVKAQKITKALKIYASMIASKYDYIDNSYELKSSIEKLPEIKITEKNKNEHYGGNNQGVIPSSCYIFENKQAFCAATRNNLIFYSSPSQSEYGQYIHSPLLALESPNKFTPSTTIQSTTLSNKGIFYLKEGEKMQIPYDVMSDSKTKSSIIGIKDMLYRNAYEDKPPTIEICWGRRNVDNYIKEKRLKYIIIEREKGERHKTYAPTCAGISISSGFMHSNEGITSLYEGDHYNFPIIWYDKKGNPLEYLTQYLNKDNKEEIYYGSPTEAVYGVIDITKIYSEGQVSENIYGSNFLIRFYNSNPASWKTNPDIRWTAKEFTINVQGEDIVRRPVIQRVYFLGESDLGIKRK